jgi:hypothetical protein
LHREPEIGNPEPGRRKAEPEEPIVEKKLSPEHPAKNLDLNLNPDEVVLKKEVFRTEFAPYLTPGPIH